MRTKAWVLRSDVMRKYVAASLGIEMTPVLYQAEFFPTKRVALSFRRNYCVGLSVEPRLVELT